MNKNLENYKEFEALNSILENDFSSFIDKELSDLEIYKIEKLELTLEKINIFQSNQTNSEITRLFDSLKEVLSIYFNNIINNFNIFHNNYFK